jgi:hypothetical protein
LCCLYLLCSSLTSSCNMWSPHLWTYLHF